MKLCTVLAALLVCAAIPAQEVRVDPEAEQPWKKTLNYRKALKIELKELQRDLLRACAEFVIRTVFFVKVIHIKPPSILFYYPLACCIGGKNMI